MYDTEPLDSPRGRPESFYAELAKIRSDPMIWGLALRRAGKHDLAQDALQETYYSVARVKDPGHIENLRAFFCKALIHEINRMLGRPGPIPVEDPETVAGARHGGDLDAHAAARPVDEAAILGHQAQAWLKRFHNERKRLRAMVPESSSDPERYRAVILATAEEVLRSAGDGQVTWADSNAALQAIYPEWFGGADCSSATHYKRLSRARREVRALLRTIVSKEELDP